MNVDLSREAQAWPVLPVLVARIEATVLQFRAADPFLPVHLLVPNHVLGTLLARSLFADTGYLAIHVELPHEFAWSIAARECLSAGLLPVPEEVDLAIVLKAAAAAVADASTPEYLKCAIPMPGFAPAALRTLRDMAAAEVAPATLEAFAPEAPDADKVRVLARIAGGHQATLAPAQLIDRETLYRRAAASLPTKDGAGVVFIGGAPESGGLEALLKGLAATHPFAWLAWNEHPGVAPRREAARNAFAERAGVALLLDLLDADLDRAQVAEFLTTARVPYRNLLGADARVSPARWDRISARAGIVAGLDAWRVGLDKARSASEEREFEDETVLLDSLRKIVEQLVADLAAFPRDGSWRGFLSATLSLLGRWIERGDLTAERLERVIGPMERLAPVPTRQQFLARVRDLIATQVYREGSLADGRVFVGPTSVAAGLHFHVVFVPGMVERRFPAIARPDPLLLDEERASLSPMLRTTIDEQEQERVEFVNACAAARERLVLSYQRVDGQSGRERVPSSFLLRAARAALGTRVDARRAVVAETIAAFIDDITRVKPWLVYDPGLKPFSLPWL